MGRHTNHASGPNNCQSESVTDADIPDAFTLVKCDTEADIARVFGKEILRATQARRRDRAGLRLLQALRLALEDSERSAFENAKATLDAEISAVPDASLWRSKSRRT